jgi:hypothetical protein
VTDKLITWLGVALLLAASAGLGFILAYLALAGQA